MQAGRATIMLNRLGTHGKARSCEPTLTVGHLDARLFLCSLPACVEENRLSRLQWAVRVRAQGVRGRALGERRVCDVLFLVVVVEAATGRIWVQPPLLEDPGCSGTAMTLNRFVVRVQVWLDRVPLLKVACMALF